MAESFAFTQPSVRAQVRALCTRLYTPQEIGRRNALALFHPAHAAHRVRIQESVRQDGLLVHESLQCECGETLVLTYTRPEPEQG